MGVGGGRTEEQIVFLVIFFSDSWLLANGDIIYAPRA